MTEEKIIGLYNINEWVREELRKPGNSHVCEVGKLGFNDRFVKLLPVRRAPTLLLGERFSDLFQDDSFDGTFPLAIDQAALGVVVNAFVKQQSEDQSFPEMAVYYQDMAGQCKGYDIFDRDEEIYPSPNALAILLYGVMEYGNGLDEEQENQFNNAIAKSIISAGKTYTWQTYYANSSHRRPEYPRHVVIGDFEIMTPTKTSASDNILGITKIEAAIIRRLTTTGNKRFIPSASLTFLEPDASLAREVLGSKQPIALMDEPDPKQWAVDRKVLGVLTDRFAGQLQNDQRVNGDLFAERIHSPAAQALLLHGITYATRDALGEQDEGLVMEIIRNYMEKTVIAHEAKNYAQCVLLGLTPTELEQENNKALRPVPRPAIGNRRVRDDLLPVMSPG